jgi:hypothetical protein
METCSFMSLQHVQRPPHPHERNDFSEEKTHGEHALPL